METNICIRNSKNFLGTSKKFKHTDKQTNRRADEQTDRQMDGWADRRTVQNGSSIQPVRPFRHGRKKMQEQFDLEESQGKPTKTRKTNENLEFPKFQKMS